MLEFTIGSAAVAVGFAGYLNALLDQVAGVTLPDAITAPPGEGGTVNVFGIAIVLLVGYLLIRGIGMTAKATLAFVVTTLAVLALVLATGTLFAFMLVALGVLYLRSAEPGRERPCRTPLSPVLPLLAIAGCGYLAIDLPADTWLRFAVWMVLGLVVYVLYARRSSRVGAARG